LLPSACLPDTIASVRSTLYLFLLRPPLPCVLSRTPWLPLLPPPPDVLSKLSSSSAITCPRAKTNHCVMPASLVDTSNCPFLAPLIEPFSPLTSYTVTFGPPLFRVSLVTSITWSFSMTSPTTRGLFRYAKRLTPSPPSLTSLPLCPRSLAAPSGASSVIMDARLITPPPALSSSLTTSSFGCRVPTLPRRTAKPSV
jgi:hypothetical protein